MLARLCCTEARYRYSTGQFRYAPIHGAWIFPKEPRRYMSAHAQEMAYIHRSDQSHQDCTGKPYTHVTCPFCGKDLPLDDKR